MYDVYSEARTYFENANDTEIRFCIFEVFTGGSVLHLTNQTEPSNVQQLRIIHDGLSVSGRVKFNRALNAAIRSCEPGSPGFLDIVAELTTLAAEIGAFECVKAIEDILSLEIDPNDEAQNRPLRSILPDLASLNIGSADGPLFFKRLADTSNWKIFLPFLTSACCFLDAQNSHLYLNEFIPIMRSSNMTYDLGDIILEIEACAGEGVLFGSLQHMENQVLQLILPHLFSGHKPPYRLTTGTDPAIVATRISDRAGFLAIRLSDESSQITSREYFIPCGEESVFLFHQLSDLANPEFSKSASNIVSLRTA